MKQRAITLRLAEYDTIDDLPGPLAGLVNQAIAAARNAYAPYSGYRVGAAVELENGKVITGNNQENAAYPSGLCAERVALFYAGSRYPEVPPKAVAIAAILDGEIQEQPVTPCGGCRQVLYESEIRGGNPLQVILYGTKKTLILQRAVDLLPLPFESISPLVVSR